MGQEDLLTRAIEALRNETGLPVKLVEKGVTYYRDQWDGRLEVEVPDKNMVIDLFAEIKTRVNRAALGPLKYQLDRANGTGIIITEYVHPRLADELKECGIQFIDAWGNAFISHIPLFVFVKGNKRDRLDQQYYAAAPRAFRPTGLKVIFALLCNPGLEDRPFRQIANETNAALGTINIVFKNLEEAGYLIDKGRRGRKLIQKGKLLERWVTAFPEALRPKVMRGRYTALDRHWWKNTQLPKHYYRGGEVAAAKMTGYLKPEIVTIYAPKRFNDFLLHNKLRKDPNGEIEILEAFWLKYDTRYKGKDETFYHYQEDLAHPILVYADLIGTKDTRTNETAKMIYDDEVTRYIRED